MSFMDIEIAHNKLYLFQMKNMTLKIVTTLKPPPDSRSLMPHYCSPFFHSPVISNYWLCLDPYRLDYTFQRFVCISFLSVSIVILTCIPVVWFRGWLLFITECYSFAYSLIHTNGLIHSWFIHSAVNTQRIFSSFALMNKSPMNNYLQVLRGKIFWFPLRK